ncbi:GntR family transcriptional regulator [Streptomyces oryzae]|uniref:GntR family transcriptional regulator n=1 Tax=Streptomyces oryzae TaxID=1434886 RepID=A0ABS3X814_9ACTN|nr:GntR family transcriptional regulator [Streptomyces oryzae]MBO8191513.1 GntR family transcriptional regulator [Streptomyces oryzae]
MPPLQTTTTRDALVAEIRREILSGDLAPGTSLTEVGLAGRYEVARPTVRSALQELGRRHLVVSNGGRSPIVPVMTDEDVRDLFFVRRPLELEAVARIVADGRDLGAAEQRLEDLRRLPGDASWGERVETHTAFHIALIDCAGSARLSRVYPGLQEEMQLCLAQLHASYPGSQDLYREHRVLLDAIRSGSREDALAELNLHLDRALGKLSDVQQR